MSSRICLVRATNSHVVLPAVLVEPVGQALQVRELAGRYEPGAQA